MSGTTTIPNDPNPALRAELLAAQAVLTPQISGLQGLATMALSAALLVQINEQIVDKANRQTLIQNVLNGLDAVVAERALLDADGYPSLPNVALPGSLFSELQQENNAIEAAVAVFTNPLTVGFDPTVKPIDVPQPVPSQTHKS